MEINIYFTDNCSNMGLIIWVVVYKAHATDVGDASLILDISSKSPNDDSRCFEEIKNIKQNKHQH